MFVLLGISANLKIMTVCKWKTPDGKKLKITKEQNDPKAEAKQYQEFL